MADRSKADAWTELPSRSALPFVQEAGEQLRNHRVATPRIWKFDTLCEHPLGKGEATCHSSLCTNYAQRICGRLLQEVMEDW